MWWNLRQFRETKRVRSERPKLVKVLKKKLIENLREKF